MSVRTSYNSVYVTRFTHPYCRMESRCDIAPYDNIAYTQALVLIKSKNMNKNNYRLLLPPKPTPKSEICKCRLFHPIKLMFTLSCNPINCVDCNLEIDLELIKINSELIKMIAYWNEMYGSIYRLWLDSDEYENWTENELISINSHINQMGLDVQKKLNKIHRCYYWLFNEGDNKIYTKKNSKCPICAIDFQHIIGKVVNYFECKNCSLQIPY